MIGWSCLRRNCSFIKAILVAVKDQAKLSCLREQWQPRGEIYAYLNEAATLVNKDTEEMKFDRDVGGSSSDLLRNRRETRRVNAWKVFVRVASRENWTILNEEWEFLETKISALRLVRPRDCRIYWDSIL